MTSINYQKFLYEKSKRESHTQPAGLVKEIQISPVIDPHDLATKRNQAIQFLCDDMKVRVKLRFLGRQTTHKIGLEVINQLIKELAPYGRADSPPEWVGDGGLEAVINPLPRSQRE